MPLVQVTLIQGRSPAVIRDLIGKVTDAVVSATEAPQESVRVIVNEVPRAHWGIGGVPKGDPE